MRHAKPFLAGYLARKARYLQEVWRTGGPPRQEAATLDSCTSMPTIEAITLSSLRIGVDDRRTWQVLFADSRHGSNFSQCWAHFVFTCHCLSVIIPCVPQIELEHTPMHNGERWLSVEEITLHLGISKESIYRWLEKGKIPAHRIGKLWKFKISEVDEWVLSGSASEETSVSPTKTRRREQQC